MSTGLLRVVERARREPEGRFHSLAHLIDVPALERAFHRLRSDAAVGVDGVSKEDYGQELEANLVELHGRMKAKRYRHQPLRRVHIPKGDGRTRPIGISAVEDKIVQGAVREVLEAVYEQDFEECSYGFRPGRGAHDAIRALNRAVYQGKVGWILEADIESFFDSLDRTKLEEMLRIRVADGSLRRLVGKCVRVGVLDGEERTEPERGAPQGSGLSPLLGNLYLHYTLDVWFEREVKPRLGGEAVLVRYCDDFVIGFERREDAQRVAEVLGKRMERYGLRLHPEKTRLIAFERPKAGQRGGKGPGTFEFLGFTMYWRRTRRGRWQKAVWPTPFPWPFVCREVACDRGVQPAQRQWRVRRTQPQEHDPAGRLGSCLTQVARDRIADPRHERRLLVTTALGSDETDPIARPVNIVEAQMAHFA